MEPLPAQFCEKTELPLPCMVVVHERRLGLVTTVGCEKVKDRGEGQGVCIYSVYVVGNGCLYMFYVHGSVCSG